MRGWAKVLGIAVLSLSIEACSFLVDSSPEQCSSHGDCTSRGGAFANSVCTKDHLCLTTCTTNKGCIDALGEPAICVRSNSKCAPLLSVDCKKIWQESPTSIENDNAVVLGIMLAHTGDDATAEIPRINAVELARKHIHRAATGLPSVGTGASRPLVMLSCDDAADPIRAARHLAEVVRVPAIVGPAFSGVTTNVATEVTIPRDVLVISPSATSPSLTDLADKGLVWRTAPSDVLQAKAMVLAIEKFIEPEVRAAYMITEPTKIRVAVVHKGDAYGAGLGNALFKTLKFNGASASANAANYTQIDYGDPQKLTAEEITAKYDAAVKQLVAFKPHIVITAGTAEAVLNVFSPLEAQWTEPAFKPRHLVSDGLQIPQMQTALTANDNLRRRVLGTIGEASGPRFDDFKNEYKLAFGTDTVPDAYAAGAYDATMLLAFAIAGAGSKPLTGSIINENLQKTAIGGAEVIEAGYSSVNAGFKAMAVGGIDYNGASGPLDFDRDKGEADADIQLWCSKGGAFVASGATFIAKQGNILGTPNCN